MSADDNMSDVEGGGAGAAISSVPTGPKDIVNTAMYVEPAVLPTSLGTDIKGIHVKCLDCKAWDKVTKLSNGYTNHLSHWRSCVKEKYDELLAERWKERCKTEADVNDGLISAADAASKKKQQQLMTITNWHRSLNMWLEHIVLKNGALSDVQCEISRSHMRYPEVKSTKTVVDMAHHLVEVIEEKIARMMDSSPACQISYDGYTNNGTHYVCLYASFGVPVSSFVGSAVVKSVRNECRLLASAPLKPIDESDSSNESDDESGDDLATSFDARHHRQYFEETFKFYDKDVSDGGDDKGYIKCQISDSTALNPAIARLMGFPHISCKNHDLSLQANKMVAETPELKAVTEAVASIAAAVRVSCKHTTALRNEETNEKGDKYGNIKAKGESQTRVWLGQAQALERHIAIAPSLIKVMDDGIGTLNNHRETVERSFMEKAKKHNGYMKFIFNVSTALQKKCLQLSDCRAYLDTLIARVARNSTRRTSIFFGCTLGTEKIGLENGLTSDPHFESGVCKIQQGVSHEVTMTDAEKHACRRLLLSSDDSDDDDDFDEEDFYASVEHEKKRKAKEVANVSDYIDCGFILGSTAATCEALWSKADEVLRKRRQGMSPRTLEMILFLKENRDLWDIRDVHEADSRRKAANKESRAAKRIAEAEEDEQMAVTLGLINLNQNNN